MWLHSQNIEPEGHVCVCT